MKNRNAVLAFFVILSTFFPAASFAEWKVFILETMHVPVVEEHSAYIQKHLLESVAKTKQKINIQSYNADGDFRAARQSLKQTLSSFKPDLVISVATLATQVASRTLKGTDIPHLFCVVADPIGAGIIPEEGADSDHHISGLMYGLERKTVVDEAVRIMRTKLPQGPIRVGMVYSRYPSATSDFNAYSIEMSKVPDIDVISAGIFYDDSEVGMQKMLEESANMIQSLEDTVDYWWQMRGPLAEEPRFHSLFKQSKKPLLFGNNLQSVQTGAVFTVSQETASTSKELAKIAIEVLNGTPVKQFKIRYAKDYVYAVNLDSAQKHNLTIPSDLLKLAGDNVFEASK